MISLSGKHARVFQVLSAWILIVACSLSANRAKAEVNIVIEEVAGNVIATYSGNVNISELSEDAYSSSGITTGWIGPNQALISFGSGNTDLYQAINGPTAFGSKIGRGADSTAGDPFMLQMLFGSTIRTDMLQVPRNYVSGSEISGSSTWIDETLETLGLTAGTYTWTWGEGANADSVSMTIVPSNSPNPDVDGDLILDAIEEYLLIRAGQPVNLETLSSLGDIEALDLGVTEAQAANAISQDPQKMEQYALYSREALGVLYVPTPLIWREENQIHLKLQLRSGPDLNNLQPAGVPIEYAIPLPEGESAYFFQLKADSTAP